MENTEPQRPTSETNLGQESGAPWDPYPTSQRPYGPHPYPTYQRPHVPDHSRDRHSGEVTSVVGVVLTLVGLALAFLVGGPLWPVWMPPLIPMLILMTMALLMAVVGAILVGRAVVRGMGRLRDVLGLLAAGAAAVISVIFLLWVTDPVERDFYTCWYGADTLEQANACDVAHNTSIWEYR